MNLRKVERQTQRSGKKRKTLFPFFFLICALILLCNSSIAAQKIAFLIPEKNSESQIVNEKIQTALSENFKILNDSLAESAAFSFPNLNFFNLSTEEAQNIGRAVGCDFFIVLKAETLRRQSLVKSAYFESYAVFYLVSSRTGRLVCWKLSSFEAETAVKSEKKLLASIGNLAAEISVNLQTAKENELNETPTSDLAELPDEDSPEAKVFRSPLPYRRFKPEYTSLADLYGVTATIDATVDLDENGKISRVEISRWAGYGLDESVKETIRKMQWRAAERNGKPLPIRVLLRYNFKKLEKEDDQ